MNDQLNFHDGSIDGLFSSNEEVHLFLRIAAEKKFTLVLRVWTHWLLVISDRATSSWAWRSCNPENSMLQILGT